MAIAFEKATRNPCSIAIFKKTSYNPSDIWPLPLVELCDYISNTSRKLMWELSFCICRADKKGKSLGDLYMTTGLEAVLSHQLSK